MKKSLAHNSNSEFHVNTIPRLYNCKWKYLITAIYSTNLILSSKILNSH